MQYTSLREEEEEEEEEEECAELKNILHKTSVCQWNRSKRSV
jgi:hypothetical protein